MKFEVSERIITSADKVALLEMLTEQFKKVSQNISLSDEKLSVRSIEASWGSINRADTTVITLKHIDGGFLIVADVHYRPSVMFWVFFVIFLFTYVAWVVPILFYLLQKNTVRQAIVHVFKRVSDEYTNESIGKGTVIEQLEKLAILKDKGIVTDEEYREKKEEILNKKASITQPGATSKTSVKTLFSPLDSDAAAIAEGNKPSELHLFDVVIKVNFWQEVFINFLKYLKDNPEYDFDHIMDNQLEMFQRDETIVHWSSLKELIKTNVESASRYKSFDGEVWDKVKELNDDVLFIHSNISATKCMARIANVMEKLLMPANSVIIKIV